MQQHTPRNQQSRKSHAQENHHYSTDPDPSPLGSRQSSTKLQPHNRTPRSWSIILLQKVVGKLFAQVATQLPIR
jgi:hypothetical protein